ncbi:hypothetical protein HK097_011365 [Rhizophlyctis rosea]|uniref:Uncharacterized protein n=1 Tax=Rhizophlyctis rosea TaxID=64517 RepID=A0AAD5SI58_9FUNG|nr:hypothetical protein HK097_011365 [Rhizophlyctis rosea]
MRNLVKLAFGYITYPAPDPGHLTLNLLDDMFVSIPAKLELISVAVSDWSVNDMIYVIKKMPSLKEMYVVTGGHVWVGDVTEIMEATGIEWLAVQFTGDMGVVVDRDWEKAKEDGRKWCDARS